MATRFYLSSTAVAPVSPSFATEWSRNTEGDRFTMSPTKDASAMTSKTFWGSGAPTADQTALCRQYVSDALAAGNVFAITDTVKCVIRCQESGTNDNINRAPVKITVVSNDGTIVQATLRTFGAVGPNTTEWAGAALTNKQLLDGDVLTAAYTTVLGDRLVIEVGGQVSAAGGVSVTGTMSFGSVSATDLAENETGTVADNPWVEFSNTVSLSGNVTVIPAIAMLTTTASVPFLTPRPATANLSTNRPIPIIVISSPIIPDVIAVLTAQFAPNFTFGFTPDLVAILTTPQAPLLNPFPDTNAVVIVTFTPVVAFSVIAVTLPGQLLSTTLAPTAVTPSYVGVPPTTTLLGAAFAPAILFNTYVPLPTTLATVTFEPTTGGPIIVIPGLATLSVAISPPLLSLLILLPTTNFVLATAVPSMGSGVIPPTAIVATATNPPALLLSLIPAKAALTSTTLIPVSLVSFAIVPGVAGMALSPTVVMLADRIALSVVNVALSQATPNIGLGVVPATKALLTTGAAPVNALTLPTLSATLMVTGLAPFLTPSPPKALLNLTRLTPIITKGLGFIPTTGTLFLVTKVPAPWRTGFARLTVSHKLVLSCSVTLFPEEVNGV